VRAFARSMAQPATTTISVPHIGWFSEDVVVTLSRTISYIDDPARIAEERDPVNIAGVLSLDLSLPSFLSYLNEDQFIGPGSDMGCFKETSRQELSKPGEKTMCFLVDTNGFTIVHPLFFTKKSSDFESGYFFGEMQPVMFQAMVNVGIFVAQSKQQRAWAITHRQWRLNKNAFASTLCRGDRLPTGGVLTCSGKLADRYLTGRFTVTYVSETNVLFIHIQQYQEEGLVAYCGALTNSCPQVAPPVTAIDEKGFCEESRNWVTENLREEASRNCRMSDKWPVYPSILEQARYAECPYTSSQILMLTVAVPVGVVLVVLIVCVIYQRSNMQGTVSLRRSCFEPAKKHLVDNDPVKTDIRAGETRVDPSEEAKEIARGGSA